MCHLTINKPISVTNFYNSIYLRCSCFALWESWKQSPQPIYIYPRTSLLVKATTLVRSYWLLRSTRQVPGLIPRPQEHAAHICFCFSLFILPPSLPHNHSRQVWIKENKQITQLPWDHPHLLWSFATSSSLRTLLGRNCMWFLFCIFIFLPDGL